MIHYAMYVILKLYCHIALSARNGRLPSRQRLSKDIVASLVTSKACYCICSVYVRCTYIKYIIQQYIHCVYGVCIFCDHIVTSLCQQGMADYHPGNVFLRTSSHHQLHLKHATVYVLCMYVVHILSISYSSIFTVYTVYAYSVIILSHRSVSKEWQIAIKATFL